MKVVWTRRARIAAEEAAKFIAHDKPGAALAWLEGLFDAVEPLSEFPLSGRVVPETSTTKLRQVIYRSHRVIYRIDGRVSILTVRHTRQDSMTSLDQL